MKKLISALACAALSTIAILPAATQPIHSHHTAQAAGQVDMKAVPELNDEKIRRIQHALHDKGFDPGPADGILGARTKGAVRDFQDRYGIKASGDLDNQTLYALGAPELAGAGQPSGGLEQR
jgi:peptidoglycan hydrolase-like protein with peptidoglycan-binding domain